MIISWFYMKRDTWMCEGNILVSDSWLTMWCVHVPSSSILITQQTRQANRSGTLQLQNCELKEAFSSLITSSSELLLPWCKVDHTQCLPYSRGMPQTQSWWLPSQFSFSFWKGSEKIPISGIQLPVLHFAELICLALVSSFLRITLFNEQAFLLSVSPGFAINEPCELGQATVLPWTSLWTFRKWEE